MGGSLKKILRSLLCLSLAIIGLCPVAGLAWRTTILEASLDNTLYQSEMDLPPVQHELSNGKGIFLFAGRTGLDGGFRVRRTLVKFDLSVLPAGSEILFAEIVLYHSRAAPGSPPSEMTLHRVLQAWSEGDSDAAGPEGQGALAEPGDATWFHRFYDSETWRLSGGYYLGEVSASTIVGSGVGDNAWTCTPRMLDDLNSWLLDPDQNFGWLLMGFEDGAMNAHRFHSREHPEVETRPRLRLVYRAPDNLSSDGFEALVTCE